MKRLLCVGLVGAATAVRAAVLPIFVNDVPLQLPEAALPTVNALAFVNQSTITVSPFTINVGLGVGGFGFSSAATLPFETFNTLYYTNELSGTMSGSPGFRFLNTTNGVRRPARWFVNEGEITTDTYLEVRADNIVSPGPLETSGAGLIRLTGKTADLTRTLIRAGQSGQFSQGSFSGGGGGLTNVGGQNIYFNDFGVTDSYWGVGTNGAFLGTGPATTLGAFSLNLPNPSSPLHANEYFFGRRIATNRVSVPKFSGFFPGFPGFPGASSDFAAFVYTNTVDGTSDLIQAVFVRTNGPDADFSAAVTFDPFSADAQVAGPAQVMVELSKWYFDPSLDGYVTNNFYLTDSLAILTNLTLFRNAAPRSGSRRPNSYEFQTTAPFNWPGVEGNTPWTNGLLDQGYVTNRVNIAYAGYSATVYTNAITALGSPFSLLSSSLVPSNQPGRVEVAADQLSLEATRIRAESTVMLRTKDLVGNQLARLVDAPLVGVDLTSKQPELVISNLALTSVQRLSGTFCAWSGYWKNQRVNPVTLATNDVAIHVLIVDHSLQTSVPVQTYQFVAHATNLVIADQLTLAPSNASFFSVVSDPIRGRKFLIDAQSLDVRGGITLPLGSSWAQSNVLKLVNFTNRGTISISGSAKYGTDRSTPYNNIVNSGTNTAVSQLARTRYFHNSGALIASGAQVQLDALDARLEGGPISLATNIFALTSFTNTAGTNFFGNTNFFFSPTNFFVGSNGLPPGFAVVTNGFATNISYTSFGATLQSYADLTISAGSLSLSNALLAAGSLDAAVVRPGRLLLSVTNSLKDAGLGAPNLLKCSGFELRRRPASGDLMGTELVSSIGINQLRTHVWAAQDLGPTVAGFSNNLALGLLGLDISANNGRALFRSASGRQALYVDYVDLLNDATNFNRTIAVNPNLTIYFANANVPVSKLDGAVGGRFRWVPDFTGPRSSTNITYPSGRTYTFNIALVRNPDLDSDGDGTPNADDITPIYVPEDAILDIALIANKLATPRAMLSWNALAYSTNAVEYKDAGAQQGWRVLTNYVHGPFTAPVQVYDVLTGASPARVYRLRVVPAANP
ncbi:MAG: hypothetical protein RJA22_1297 [Verrucomicrobiota bacterium]|jgi:hypothetical protein